MDVTAIILAAGKGTRMKSSKAKVLHELFFAPMIHHVLKAISALSIQNTYVVTGHQAEEVEKELSVYPVQFVRQIDQLGTGHAVLVTEKFIPKKSGVVLVLCGDTPLIRPETLMEMIFLHKENADKLTVMTTTISNPENYGRVITDEAGNLTAIVEEKDASEQEKCIHEVNAGIYCADASFLFESLKKVGTDNQQGEIYLTDIVRIASESDIKVKKFVCTDASEIIGVNSRLELERAAKVLQKRRNLDLMNDGISIMDTNTVFIENTVSIENDTIIYPHVYISGKTNIGKGVKILPFTKIHNTKIDDNSIIESFSNLSGKSLD